MNENIKLIPYGMTDFASIIRENYYYVDKTRYIQEVEKTARFFFFVRPRRFGKSLFLNMLAYYYDCYQADSFEELFGGLYVGKHPTTNRNKYMVLKLSFAGISADPSKMQDSFESYGGRMLDAFAEKYEALFPEGFVGKMYLAERVESKLNLICTTMRNLELKMYLILDEYDNFANNVLASYGTERYRSLTHGDGFLREFMKSVKDNTDNVIERMYITGVSPVTMDDLTSGFNIADNYSTDGRFNGMIGFSETEVRALLGYYQEQKKFVDTEDELVEMMKPWYDNYCFSNRSVNEPSMYNSDMVLYFVNRYLAYQLPPENMIDTNCRTDYNKLSHLIQMDREFGINASIIQEVVTKGGTYGIINPGFSAQDMVKPDNFKSLLFYYGMLTIDHVEAGDTFLSIPNHVVREQLYNYLIEAYRNTRQMDLNVDELNQLMKRMAYYGEWENYFRYIAAQLKAQSAIREFMEGEAHVKGFILAYMGMNRYYMVLPEYEMNKGYSDFYMQPNLPQLPDMPYSYVVEVKYCARDSKDAVFDELLAEAVVQLDKYARCEKIQQTKGSTELRKIAVVFRGWDLERFVEI